jgi:hypothetical protein
MELRPYRSNHCHGLIQTMPQFEPTQFNKLFTGLLDDVDDADLSGASADADSGSFGSQRKQHIDRLIADVTQARSDAENAHQRLIEEIMRLRGENERLRTENHRWRHLVRQYKQILNGR